MAKASPTPIGAGLLMAAGTLLLGCDTGPVEGTGGGSGACPTVTGTQVRFDPELAPLGESEAQNWLAYPFPSDHRRVEDGNIDLNDFPNQFDILEDYADYGTDEIDGFGLNSPIYFAFDAPLGLSSIPTYAADFMSEQAPLQLVDITEGSSEYGTRRPLRWHHWAIEGNWVTPNMLGVATEWGFPLREQTTYALLITNAVTDDTGNPLAQPALLNHLLGGGAPATCGGESVPALYEQFAPLRALLAADEIAIDSIAAATVFTTQTITSELAAIYADVRDNLPAPTLEESSWRERGGPGVYWEEEAYQWQVSTTDEVPYWVMEGSYQGPNYQVGELPYTSLSKGGDLNFVGGAPEVDHWEELRFFLTIPQAPPPDGSNCYPVVEYAHGTTGDAQGFTGAQAGRNAARGLATIGIDQPLHGARWGGSDDSRALFSFNFLNPASFRSIFRQSAADTFYLTRLVRETLQVPASRSPTGAGICFDSDRVSFLGHSHGALSGALAAAFEPDIENWVLSGGGGGLSITVMLRNDVFTNPSELIETLLPFAEGEELHEMHPVTSMLQLIVELTDPINYSPYWVHLDTYAPPRNFFVTSGELDEATPHRTATAMSVAAYIPIVQPVAIPVPTYFHAGVPYASAPLTTNLAGKTAGFMQWGANDGLDASHWVAFTRREAINAYTRFLESAVYESEPVLERVVNANVR